MDSQLENKTFLTSPVAYQGGKCRIAAKILDFIQPNKNEVFHDLCCGSGAISIELIRRGYDPKNICMLDIGPWGTVWEHIGAGEFDLNKFQKICNQVPKDKTLIKSFMESLSKQPANIDTPYVFLLLQASSFGGKAIWIEDNAWQNCSFRRYWMPTKTSNRRSPVNPMMPMTETLFHRMVFISKNMSGIRGLHTDIQEFLPDCGVAYIDPPYNGTTKYGHNFNLALYLEKLKIPCYVSEGYPLSTCGVKIDTERQKGGISGGRKRNANQEWLSKIHH